MSFISKEAYDDLQCRYIQVADMLRRIVADYRRSDEDARGVSAMEFLIEDAERLLPVSGHTNGAHYARFELRKDDDTGRLYWWGAEDGWKDPTEIGENGVLTLDAAVFAIGTVLTMTEPEEAQP